MAKFKICCHLIQFENREQTEPEWVLNAVADAGYEGCEGFGPKTADELVDIAALAATYGLHIVNIAGPTNEEKVLYNVALYNNAVEVPAARRANFGGPNPTDEDFARAGAELEEIIAYAEMYHMKPFHHAHIGTMIETKEDADRMLAATPGLYLLLDTGHLTCAGSDALEVLWAHRARIGHVHLKDFFADDPSTWSWPESKFWEEGRFKELGDGNMGLDVPGILKALEEIGYDGWVSVELDRASMDMAEAAKYNREYLRRLGY